MDPLRIVRDTAHLRCAHCAEAMTDDWSVIKAAAQFHTALNPTHTVIVSHVFTMNRLDAAPVIGNELNTWLPSREDTAEKVRQAMRDPRKRKALMQLGYLPEDTDATDAPVREYGDAPIREYGMPCVYCNRTDGPYRYELDTRCSACNRRWMGAGRRVLWDQVRGTVTHVHAGGLRFDIRWDFSSESVSYPRVVIISEIKSGHLHLSGMED